MTPIAKVVLIAAGVFIADRVNKMPLVLTFLGAYFLLFTVTAFVSDPLPVAEIFRTPDVEAALYFAFIILTDPPTSPAKYPDQIVCGLIVAVVSLRVFRIGGRGLLSAGGRAGGQCVGGVAAREPATQGPQGAANRRPSGAITGHRNIQPRCEIFVDGYSALWLNIIGWRSANPRRGPTPTNWYSARWRTPRGAGCCSRFTSTAAP